MRILVVEDNSQTVSLLVEYLRLIDCDDVSFAGDGLGALTSLAIPGQPLPDVILLDARMPGMDGEEFLERVQENSKWRGIPVVMISAVSLDEQAHIRHRWPYVKFMSKPFEPDELRKVLSEIGSNL